MFGIMKKSCGESCSTDQKENYRLHYCGTCKSIGSIYGQGSRLFLNFDVVFLSELLAALSAEKPSEWQEGYQSFNCFARIDGDNIPLAFQYASAVNVFLSDLKIKDHIQDEKKLLWKGAKLTYHRPFKKASRNLSQFGLPIEEIEQLFQQQLSLEKENHTLEEYAYPTSKITSLIFKQGGVLIKKNEAILEKIGFHFGKLAYILDAIEDYDKDIRSNNFNGIKHGFQLGNHSIDLSIKNQVNEIIFSIQEKIISLIEVSAFSEETKKVFISRLSLNIHKKIYTQNEIVEEYYPSWAESKQKIKDIVKNIQNPIKRQIQYASLSLVVYINPETLNTLQEIDYHHISISATITTLFSALACFAGKKKRRWMKRLRKFSRRKNCIECNICSTACCGSCDCSPCADSCVDGCCDICFETDCCTDCTEECNDEGNRCLNIMFWTFIAAVIIGIIALIILLV